MSITLYVPTVINLEGTDENFTTAARAPISRADALDRLLYLVSQTVGPAHLEAAGPILERSDVWAFEDHAFVIVTTKLEIGAVGV